MVPSLISLIYCIIFKGNEETALKIHESWKTFKDLMPSNGLIDSVKPDGAIEWIAKDLSDTFNASISNLTDFHLIIFWTPLMWIITIFFSIRLFSGFKKDPFFNSKRLFIFIQLIPFIPLFIIAHDYGRWIFIWITSSCLLFSFLIILFNRRFIILEKNIKKIITFDILFPNINTERKYNLILLFLGVPHCCWSLGRYLVSNPIGFSIKNIIFYLSIFFN